MDDKALEIYEGGIKLHQLTEAILYLEKRINPSLSTQGVDVKKYAEKIFFNANIITIKKDEQIVGVSAFYANDYEKFVGFLSFIAIHEKLTGKGFGRKLLMETEKKSASLGMKKMCLEVFKANLHAINFYRKMGYIESAMKSAKSLFMEKNID